MLVFAFLAGVGLLSSTCFAAVVPTCQFITLASLDEIYISLPSTPTDKTLTADPDVRVNFHWQPGTIPHPACLGLMAQALAALANADWDSRFQGTTLRPADPEVQGCHIDICPIGRDMAISTAFLATCEISTKVWTSISSKRNVDGLFERADSGKIVMLNIF